MFPATAQLLKLVVVRFPAYFFALSSRRLDFTKVEWLLQEVFSDPPDGGKRTLDLVAKVLLRYRPGDPWFDPGLPEWIPVLIHIEFESADSVRQSPRRFR